ncbi:hypothetical protein KBD49_14115 [Myxococcota bacterium]|jgi:YbbR domain-containing protein|nr:hypothetical protein [Myxococcota bacterium]
MADDQNRDPPPGRTAATSGRWARRPGAWRRALTDHLGLKALSLAIAVALFVFVREDKGKEVEVEIPVTLSNLDDNTVFVGDIPSAVRVRIRDRWSRLVRVLENKPSPYLVDLRGYRDGAMFAFDRNLIERLLGVSGLSILSVSPAEFTVALEPKAERLVPVRAVLVGQPPEGYFVIREKVRVIPGQVRVWGSRTSLKGFEALSTLPVDVSAMERDSRVQVQVQKPALPFFYVDDVSVQVEVPIQVAQGRDVRNRVEVEVLNCPQNLQCQVEPPVVDVTLTGPVPTLRKVGQQLLPVNVVLDIGDLDTTVSRHDGLRPFCKRPEDLLCTLTPRSVSLILAGPGVEDRRRPKGR